MIQPEIQAQLDEIKSALGGDAGIRVRLAIAERDLFSISEQVGSIKVELLEHRRVSSAAHNEALAELRAMRGGTLAVDATTLKALGLIVAAALSALGLGGVAASAVSPEAAVPAAVPEPAPAATP